MNKLSVILVEDDKDLSDITAEHLRLRNVNVKQVYSGIEFYAALQHAVYDAAIIDLGLPDQPGTVLIQYAAANTQMAILVVSAYDQTAKRITCYEAGADTFLPKPVDPEELHVALVGLAKKSAARVAEESHLVVGRGHEEIKPQISPNTDNKTDLVHEKWVLDTLKRQLLSPEHIVVDLNHNEFKLCYRLALSNGDIVHRAHMLESIYKRDDESAQRALDTLVRRLRKKIADETEGLTPIMTTYGVGHSFTDHIDIIR
jgi:DNA-binding response OmpR family regulator